MHILLIDDIFPINTRNTKILNSLSSHYKDEAKISVITWNRTNSSTDGYNNYFFYNKVSAYGHKFRKLMNLWGYRKFCHDTIRRLNPDIIIASHWNNLLLVPKLDTKRQMLIYDNLDIPTGPKVLRDIAAFLEKQKMKKADLTIHASRFFAPLYSKSFNQLVLENKPVFTTTPIDYHLHTPIRIAFIGLIRHLDILRNLISAVRGNPNFQLYLHGDGHASMQLQEYSKEDSNVFFTGRYSYNEIDKLYEQADVIWAAYPNKDFNVKYAISNKFHESLIFGLPTIYSENTQVGEFASRNHIGIQVNPYSVDSIKSLLDKIVSGSINLKQIHDDMVAYQSTQTSWNTDFAEVTKQIQRFFSHPTD